MTKKELLEKKPEELADLVLAKTKENDELLATLKDMEATIEDLANAQKDAAKGIKTLTVGKQKYLVVTPKFRVGAQVYTWQDLKADKELLKEVLELDGQNILKPIK